MHMSDALSILANEVKMYENCCQKLSYKLRSHYLTLKPLLQMYHLSSQVTFSSNDFEWWMNKIVVNVKNNDATSNLGQQSFLILSNKALFGGDISIQWK